MMPSKYSLQTLPKPSNSKITILEIPASRYVVIRFSGLASEKKLALNTQKLEAFCKEKGWKTIGPAIYAFYNPPWTLPFLRRNEVMLAKS